MVPEEALRLGADASIRLFLSKGRPEGRMKVQRIFDCEGEAPVLQPAAGWDVPETAEADEWLAAGGPLFGGASPSPSFAFGDDDEDDDIDDDEDNFDDMEDDFEDDFEDDDDDDDFEDDDDDFEDDDDDDDYDYDEDGDYDDDFDE
jgi:hypothetical protein